MQIAGRFEADGMGTTAGGDRHGDPRPDAGRLVYYEVCVSLVLVTLRRPSGLYRLRPGEWGLWRGLPYALVTFLLGWWGVPWGLVYTPRALWANLTGGRDVTPAVAEHAGGAG